jgi:hypothetical protein
MPDVTGPKARPRTRDMVLVLVFLVSVDAIVDTSTESSDLAMMADGAAAAAAAAAVVTMRGCLTYGTRICVSAPIYEHIIAAN